VCKVSVCVSFLVSHCMSIFGLAIDILYIFCSLLLLCSISFVNAV